MVNFWNSIIDDINPGNNAVVSQYYCDLESFEDDRGKIIFLFSINTLVLNAIQHEMNKMNNKLSEDETLPQQNPDNLPSFSNVEKVPEPNKFIQIQNPVVPHDYVLLIKKIGEYLKQPTEICSHGLQAVLRFFPVKIYYKDGCVCVRVYPFPLKNLA